MGDIIQEGDFEARQIRDTWAYEIFFCQYHFGTYDSDKEKLYIGTNDIAVALPWGDLQLLILAIDSYYP